MHCMYVYSDDSCNWETFISKFCSTLSGTGGSSSASNRRESISGAKNCNLALKELIRLKLHSNQSDSSFDDLFTSSFS